ncbi:TrmH family RNA methyltransferase [Parablautia muri]|uniref:RNA methyltransferase n=1 Tax=Parablautia muri TaxID=2320879 RepID=A0A9X5GTT9_9FIRM|nr:RNA methyltransferase [Parablautia muri]NBJ94361.1 RNA methyltransferase [Parablautia muri]
MITSLTNGRVKQLVALQEKSHVRNKERLFVAEGIKMFEEAPTDRIREVYLSKGLWEQLGAESRYGSVWEKLAECERQGIKVEQTSEEVFRRISDTRTPQGILFVAEQFSYFPEELLERAGKRWKNGGRPPLFLLTEDIQDPGNLGTMLRTGEGAGVDGVIMSKGTVDVYNPKTIRSTMGSLYRVPFAYTDSLEQVIGLLRERGVLVYAAHLKGEKYFDEIAYEGGSAFLVGNEGKGLKEETAGLADAYLKIPMEGMLESLNAAVAAALLLYQASGYVRKARLLAANS